MKISQEHLWWVLKRKREEQRSESRYQSMSLSDFLRHRSLISQAAGSVEASVELEASVAVTVTGLEIFIAFAGEYSWGSRERSDSDDKGVDWCWTSCFDLGHKTVRFQNHSTWKVRSANAKTWWLSENPNWTIPMLGWPSPAYSLKIMSYSTHSSKGAHPPSISSC